RAPAAALAPFKVSVAGGSAAFARLQNVRVHSQTHGASRLSPLETCLLEDFMQAFLLGCVLDGLRAGHHHRPHFSTYMMTFRHTRGFAQVFQARVGARADEYAVHRNLLDRRTRI